MINLAIQALSGPIDLLLGTFDLAALGYEADEYFVSGEATSYSAVGALGSDGIWVVEPAAKAPFTTRIVVVKPCDANRFNGTVIVEWVNVTSGYEIPFDWLAAHREFVREGYVYVAVSAQRVGIEGGLSRGSDAALKTVNPLRYGALSHPGDAYSYDIFSQIGRSIRAQSAAVLGALVPDRLIAVGESQSAWYLTTYINAIDAIAREYDGFLLHSRFAPVAPLDSTSIFSETPSPMPDATVIRADVRVPVLTVITETDLIGGLRPGFHAARQDDTSRLRIWEISGAAHVDHYMLNVSIIDSGLLDIAALAAACRPQKSLFGKTLEQYINFAPQHHYVFQAAIASIHRWVKSGELPPIADRLALTAGPSPALVLDTHGVAVAGIRTPWVDVPVARTSGAGDASDATASMFGTGAYFDGAKLLELYPQGQAEYVSRFEAALDRSISAGFLLAADRVEILQLAAACYPQTS